MRNRNYKIITMKKIFIPLFSAMFALSVSAQQKTNQDSVRHLADTDTIEIRVKNEKKKVRVIFEMGKERKEGLKTDTILTEEVIHTIKKAKKYPDVHAGITFSNFDLGMAKMIDNGKGSLSAKNEFLRYRPWKSINVGFDVAQFGYRFSDQFRINLSAGFDWTLFRLKQNIIIKEDSKPLDYDQSAIDYTKNRFSSSYLRLPLTFEFRSKAGTFPQRLRFATGPIAGILIQGSQKFKSKEEGKKKNVNDYNYAPFRYGGFARVSYGNFGLYGKYYVNDMFQNSPDQEGLKNISFGLQLYF